jgi:hypothetical protein
MAVLTMTACGKPNQALPEQEKGNFAKILSQQPSADQPAAPSSETGAAAGSDTSSKAEAGATTDASK